MNQEPKVALESILEAKLDHEVLHDLAMAGFEYTPQAVQAGDAPISVALHTGQLGEKEVPLLQVSFSGLNFLETRWEVLDEISARNERKTPFCLTGSGYILISKELFLDRDGKSTLSLRDYTCLGATVDQLFREFYRIKGGMVIGLPAEFVSYHPEGVQVIFTVTVESNADTWQKIFQLKTTELTGASEYHNKLVGAATGSVKAEDLSPGRNLN
jgi:hypothetical protein